MVRIYTRRGDKGMTGIAGGERVAKTDSRIEANGTLDELNSLIGVARSYTDNPTRDEVLRNIQESLMLIMSVVATPSGLRESNGRIFPDDRVGELEKYLDEISEKGNIAPDFILPGGCKEASFLHLARTVCRRGERELWRLNGEDRVEESVMCYINRLSDLLFAMAREVNCENGIDNQRWKRFGDRK